MPVIENYVEFPHLFGGLVLKINRVAFSIFGIDIYWYGLLITAGVVLGILLALYNARRSGLLPDSILDSAFFGIVGAIIGARAYYVIFWNLNPDNYPKYGLREAIFGIRDGGLAVYGGILLGLLFVALYIRRKKLRYTVVFDLAAMSLPVGQAIGRWGNFVNQEAFGAVVSPTYKLGMTGDHIIGSGVFDKLYSSPEYADGARMLVHPCFFYESMWCLLGAVLLFIYYRTLRRFDGEVALLYIVWYGAGRAVIEGLRTDSLYIGDLRVSQVLAVLSAVIAAAVYVVCKVRRRSGLYRDSYASKLAREKHAALIALSEQGYPGLIMCV